MHSCIVWYNWQSLVPRHVLGTGSRAPQQELCNCSVITYFTYSNNPVAYVVLLSLLQLQEVSIAMAAGMSALPAHVGVEHQSSPVQLSQQQKGSQHHTSLQLQTEPTDGLSLSRSLLFTQPGQAQQQAQQQASGIDAGVVLGGPVAAAALEGDAQQLRQLPVPSRNKVSLQQGTEQWLCLSCHGRLMQWCQTVVSLDRMTRGPLSAKA